MSLSRNVEKLTSLKNQDGLLISDSLKVSKKILASKKFTPLELYFEEGLELENSFKDGFPEVQTLSKSEFIKIKGQHFHKGVISIFKDTPINEVNSIDDIEGPFVILNGVTSPENVGAIIRTIAGLGFKSLIVDEKSCAPHNRRVIRVSMGNFVYLNLYKSSNLTKIITETSRTVYATANDNNAIEFTKWNPEKESGFVIGSEGHGIEEVIKLACNKVIKIPINEKVQHLNAGHACAIISSRYLN
ncbi:MAG: RNA methyltransferase [Halobacteriovoraceae bacterium]|nr:RNA methyltransferase [Halobacteriovoraceae bacterium]